MILLLIFDILFLVYHIVLELIAMNNLLDKNLLYAEVINISWERINLYIDVELKYNEGFEENGPLDFYAVNEKFEAKAKFQATKISNNIYRLYLNITNTGYNSCLPRGAYTIVICQNDHEIAHCMTAPSIVKKMNDFSRSFLFANRSKTYVVVFFVDDTEEYALPFVMYAMAASAISIEKTNNFSISFSEKNNNELNTKKSEKKKPSKKMFNKKNKRKIFRKLYSLLLKINCHSKKTILFMSEQNKGIGGNLKAVSDRMIERGLDKEYKLLYSFRSSVAEKPNLKSWFIFLNKLSKSTMIFMDDHAPVMDWLDISSKTKIIQLWHAGAGFKSAGYSRWGNKGCPSPYSCHRQYDYGISGSKNISHFFSEVWGINAEQVLPTGMPRIDQYLNEDYRKAKTEELYALYPMCKDKKVILFAPTYRGKNKADAHYPYELIDFEKLYKLCADEYVVLFKMHPWVSESVPIPEEYTDKFFDVGAYPNINDLFYITSLLITDYSSNIFEYSLMRKPMLFFAYDEIQYSFSRGFHRDYELSAPGKVVHTFDELLNAIENKDFEQYKVDEYVEHHFDYIDCNASDRVIDWIVLGKLPKEIKNSIENKYEEVKGLADLEFVSNSACESLMNS